ncbi:hypothetical protein GCM10028808_48860 [Spirosoma migulaei]
MPEFILENFELTSIDRQDGVFQVHIEEKNADAQDPERKNLLSKGFFPTITVQDFPIRGHQVFLHIKHRQWPPWRGLIPKRERWSTEIGLK